VTGGGFGWLVGPARTRSVPIAAIAAPGRPEPGAKMDQPPQCVAGSLQNHVQGITKLAIEVVATHSMFGLEVAVERGKSSAFARKQPS